MKLPSSERFSRCLFLGMALIATAVAIRASYSAIVNVASDGRRMDLPAELPCPQCGYPSYQIPGRPGSYLCCKAECRRKVEFRRRPHLFPSRPPRKV
jgi:hypothetical protein